MYKCGKEIKINFTKWRKESKMKKKKVKIMENILTLNKDLPILNYI
jgi:hypothetical protein